ncbi:hypothetical protein ACJCFO_002853 [Acinetobacter baumannii]|nr:hypothetical protein [Acinetobacter baumannii]EKU8237870.1 hypothetical protein [Acinetobacter baumannii]EKU8309795.1 hypothetical protein [Acinetobacter baumannii]EKU8413579.1 hypothetical protein [Acinetobacter baumannii]EKU9263369.1 hypothetical protein [Acinetobacter baumannii]
MNIIKALVATVVSITTVIIRFASGFERIANSFDQATRALETKTTNFANLVELNDEATFEKEKARIAKRRAKYIKKDDAIIDVEPVQAVKRKEFSLPNPNANA